MNAMETLSGASHILTQSVNARLGILFGSIILLLVSVVPAQENDLRKPADRVLCRVDGRDVTWEDLTGTSYGDARKLAERWESRAASSTRDWWNSRGGIQPSGPPKKLAADQPLFQGVLDAACQGLVDLVFLQAVYQSVNESNADPQDKAYAVSLEKNMQEFARCMHVLDTALAAVADGKEPPVVLQGSAELREMFQEKQWTSIANGAPTQIRAFRLAAFPIIQAGSNEPSHWVRLDFNGHLLHKAVVEMAIADQAKYAQMVVQQHSLVSAVAIDVANAQELAEFQKLLDQVVDYEAKTFDYTTLRHLIQKKVSLGYTGRISLMDRQFHKDLEADFPCDFTTTPIGVWLAAGEGEDGRQRYCAILARESTLDKPLAELTLRNSNRVRNMGVRESLRPHVKKVASTFEAMAPWKTPNLDRVHQMVSSYPPSRIGKKELPAVSRP